MGVARSGDKASTTLSLFSKVATATPIKALSVRAVRFVISIFPVVVCFSAGVHAVTIDPALEARTPGEKKICRLFIFTLTEHVETFFRDNNDDMVENIRTKNVGAMKALQDKFEDSVKGVLLDYIPKNVLHHEHFNRAERRAEMLFVNCLDKTVTADVVVDAFKQNPPLPPEDVHSGPCHVARIMIFMSARKQVKYSLDSRSDELKFEDVFATWTPFIFSVHGISGRSSQEQALRDLAHDALDKLRSALPAPAPITGPGTTRFGALTYTF